MKQCMCTQFRLSTHVLSNQREVYVKRIIWMYNYRNLSKLIDPDKNISLQSPFHIANRHIVSQHQSMSGLAHADSIRINYKPKLVRHAKLFIRQDNFSLQSHTCTIVSQFLLEIHIRAKRIVFLLTCYRIYIYKKKNYH